ncbi:unnamed protein product [Amoebophrya sp. A25]|nr:unnamed protein product [Amoebophrya sp. A25]CAD7976902.1 unnamed protein product [Amoebophrya sp. A25]CAD7976904.1 unnamed protein product [Amoebophrya sp. A25]|eukprot:GSA25T00026566001.1
MTVLELSGLCQRFSMAASHSSEPSVQPPVDLDVDPLVRTTAGKTAQQEFSSLPGEDRLTDHPDPVGCCTPEGTTQQPSSQQLQLPWNRLATVGQYSWKVYEGGVFPSPGWLYSYNQIPGTRTGRYVHLLDSDATTVGKELARHQTSREVGSVALAYAGTRSGGEACLPLCMDLVDSVRSLVFPEGKSGKRRAFLAPGTEGREKMLHCPVLKRPAVVPTAAIRENDPHVDAHLHHDRSNQRANIITDTDVQHVDTHPRGRSTLTRDPMNMISLAGRGARGAGGGGTGVAATRASRRRNAHPATCGFSREHLVNHEAVRACPKQNYFDVAPLQPQTNTRDALSSGGSGRVREDNETTHLQGDPSINPAQQHEEVQEHVLTTEDVLVLQDLCVKIPHCAGFQFDRETGRLRLLSDDEKLGEKYLKVQQSPAPTSATTPSTSVVQQEHEEQAGRAGTTSGEDRLLAGGGEDTVDLSAVEGEVILGRSKKSTNASTVSGAALSKRSFVYLLQRHRSKGSCV